MRNQLYKIGLLTVPKRRISLCGKLTNSALQGKISKIFEKERVRGACIVLFDGEGRMALWGGKARKDGSLAVERDTVFRVASLTKMVTAYGVMRLSRAGKIDLDRDIGEYLGYPVRNRAYPDVPVSLRMLLNHTSSIIDSEIYLNSPDLGGSVGQILQGNAWADRRPGEQWEYSNFAAGMIACVLESALHQSFEKIMQENCFAPLQVQATYYPQRVQGDLADAWRLFPPSAKANFDAQKRQSRPYDGDLPDPDRHFLLSQGSLCISADELARLSAALVSDREIFAAMREGEHPFGARDKNLSEGLGLFIYRKNGRTLYGHQGLAYGAVHGVFFDEQGKGFVCLTSAASEEREGVMTALNQSLCQAIFEEN